MTRFHGLAIVLLAAALYKVQKNVHTTKNDVFYIKESTKHHVDTLLQEVGEIKRLLQADLLGAISAARTDSVTALDRIARDHDRIVELERRSEISDKDLQYLFKTDERLQLELYGTRDDFKRLIQVVDDLVEQMDRSSSTEGSVQLYQIEEIDEPNATIPLRVLHISLV